MLALVTCSRAGVQGIDTSSTFVRYWFGLRLQCQVASRETDLSIIGNEIPRDHVVPQVHENGFLFVSLRHGVMALLFDACKSKPGQTTDGGEGAS